MTQQKIDAQRITKPIQLLAAWLIGLVLVNGCFLATATTMGPGWERLILVIAAVLNVPGFLLAIFLLQTKFRPELQEDAFYYEYISRKTNVAVEVNKIDLLDLKITEIQNKIDAKLFLVHSAEINDDILTLDWSRWEVAINCKLPFYNDLKTALLEVGIPISNVFGAEIKTPLHSFVVSFSEEMELEYVIAILNVLTQFPMQKVEFWLPIREVGENEDVYIGAYGPHSRAIPINEDTRPAILAARDRSDLLKLRAP